MYTKKYTIYIYSGTSHRQTRIQYLLSTLSSPPILEEIGNTTDKYKQKRRRSRTILGSTDTTNYYLPIARKPMQTSLPNTARDLRLCLGNKTPAKHVIMNEEQMSGGVNE